MYLEQNEKLLDQLKEALDFATDAHLFYLRQFLKDHIESLEQKIAIQMAERKAVNWSTNQNTEVRFE